jgi:hypothetical protein
MKEKKRIEVYTNNSSPREKNLLSVLVLHLVYGL